MTALVTALSLLVLVLAVLPRIPVRSARTLPLLLPDFFLTAWAHYVAAAGAITALVATAVQAPIAMAAAFAATLLASDYVQRVTSRGWLAFQRGLGTDWHGRLDRNDERRMLQKRWSWRAPKAPAARLTPDLTFATLPGGRALLCDVWEPPASVPRSGLAVVYLHGSAWCLLDKDVGTRPFFAHLAAQGHVVMDVAYRLCPETNGVGMVADAKRAVVWMKEHAADWGVDPSRVVLMGASAGAHAALLAAYSQGKPELTPEELRGRDTSVAAVVSYYGVTDLLAYERYARQFQPKGPLAPPGPRVPLTPKQERLWRRIFGERIPVTALPPPPGHATLMGELAGGLPDQVPEMFARLSPVRHVTRDSPPTLIFHAGYDHIVPLESARALHRALLKAGVPVVYVELPFTHHAFDFMYPPLFSPAAQAALYDCERFLGWLNVSLKFAGPERSLKARWPQPTTSPLP